MPDHTAHTPPLHEAVAWGRSGQPAPQPPQLVALEVRSVSQPLPVIPSQFPQPAAHPPMEHAPAVQVEVAWASAHRVPQPPQLFGSSAVRTSQPLARSPSHSAEPVAHAPGAHAPPMQYAPAVRKLHARPHAPQYSAALRRSRDARVPTPFQKARGRYARRRGCRPATSSAS